jgi:hypothetical protein
MKKYTIQVRRYLPGQTQYGSERIGKITGDLGKFEVVKTVKRVLRAEQIGNFNPLFCTYGGNNRCLVNSDEGDASDPFRREESYARSFFILDPERKQQ